MCEQIETIEWGGGERRGGGEAGLIYSVYRSVELELSFHSAWTRDG